MLHKVIEYNDCDRFYEGAVYAAYIISQLVVPGDAPIAPATGHHRGYQLRSGCLPAAIGQLDGGIGSSPYLPSSLDRFAAWFNYPQSHRNLL